MLAAPLCIVAYPAASHQCRSEIDLTANAERDSSTPPTSTGSPDVPTKWSVQQSRATANGRLSDVRPGLPIPESKAAIRRSFCRPSHPMRPSTGKPTKLVVPPTQSSGSVWAERSSSRESMMESAPSPSPSRMRSDPGRAGRLRRAGNLALVSKKPGII